MKAEITIKYTITSADENFDDCGSADELQDSLKSSIADSFDPEEHCTGTPEGDVTITVKVSDFNPESEEDDESEEEGEDAEEGDLEDEKKKD